MERKKPDTQNSSKKCSQVGGWVSLLKSTLFINAFYHLNSFLHFVDSVIKPQ